MEPGESIEVLEGPSGDEKLGESRDRPLVGEPKDAARGVLVGECPVVHPSGDEKLGECRPSCELRDADRGDTGASVTSSGDVGWKSSATKACAS